jgi:hypothetical protein
VNRRVAAEPALYALSARLFALFCAAMAWAFWPTYFSRLFEQPDLRFHVHGVALVLWCVLLVLQAQLIRTGRRALHRAFGMTAYVLAPAVVLISVSFVHFRVAPALGGAPRLPPYGLHFLALTLLSLLVFAVFYGLAIAYRKRAPLHARFMVATVFPLFTPVTDRLVGGHWRALIAWLPQIDGTPILPSAGFALVDAIVAALAWWDWRANRRAVFCVVLAVLVIFQTAVLSLHRVAAWNAFCVWFLALPLS